jgi:hypothetical protein
MIETKTAHNTKIAAIYFCWATKELRKQKTKCQPTFKKLQPS